LNKADYFTKHHPASHHQQIRSSYLHLPQDRNKNYFECLQDEDTASVAAPHQESAAATILCPLGSSEGVLITQVRGTPGTRSPKDTPHRGPGLSEPQRTQTVPTTL
jgi:hypothetical protein